MALVSHAMDESSIAGYVWGLGFRIQALEMRFRVEGLGFEGVGCYGLGFVLDSWFRV